MAGKRRKFSPQFKSQIALEAIKGNKTIAQIAAEHQLHPGQIAAWKKQLLGGVEEVFANGSTSRKSTEDKELAVLYEEIGRLKMDITWLEKKLGVSR